MANPYPNVPERANTVNVSTTGCAKVDKAPPLEDFNNAYDAIRQVHDRLISLIAALKGEDCGIAETCSSAHSVHDMLTNMPDNIRNECRTIDNQITDLEQILLT